MTSIEITTLGDTVRITREMLQVVANEAYAFGVGAAADDWERGFAAGIEAFADHLTGRRKHSNVKAFGEAVPSLRRD